MGPSQETELSTACETDGFSTSMSKQKELNENFKKMFGTSHGFDSPSKSGFSDSPIKSPSRRSSKSSSIFSAMAELPHYMKPTELCQSRSREPIHKREVKLEVPESPKELKTPKRKPIKSASKTPVQRIDTVKMDSYRKVVQSNIKSCRNLLENYNN